MNKRIYPAKLLLIGEYTVLLNSSALAIPYPQFSGHWMKTVNAVQIWPPSFIEYLKKECASFLSVSMLDQLISQYYFELSIPIGYGLGSSGALVAAIYEECAPVKAMDLEMLQSQLGAMESYFHGKSSGFDPLISYVNKPVLKQQQQPMQLAVLPDGGLLSRFVLVDSHAPRSDKKELIPAFLKMAKMKKNDVDFLAISNNSAISALLENDESSLISSLREISDWQYANMKDWIHPNILKIWNEDEQQIFKICGAGGGGYYLKYQVGKAN